MGKRTIEFEWELLEAKRALDKLFQDKQVAWDEYARLDSAYKNQISVVTKLKKDLAKAKMQANVPR